MHEPTRGQTYKSVLRREVVAQETATVAVERSNLHRKKVHEEDSTQRKKFLLRVKNKPVEGKGVVKERNDSEYASRRMVKNVIKVHEDNSEDISE
ncbi:IcmF-like protein [Operophtera brumata]|uniref:IcmF-like protein n=1 Tax=Operophtera brumata TaxID=104452 RepID=A0A0L7K495_OPEBR|nr:IcmF-like protein [Operophtera brumata]